MGGADPVFRRGQPLEEWSSGIDYPVEPGVHDVSYSVHGQVRRQGHVVVRQGQRAVVRLRRVR